MHLLWSDVDLALSCLEHSIKSSLEKPSIRLLPHPWVAVASKELAPAESHLCAAPYTVLNISTADQAARSNWYWRQTKVSSACVVPGDNLGNVTGNFPASPFESPEQSQGSIPVLLKFGKTKKEKEIKPLQLIKEEEEEKKETCSTFGSQHKYRTYIP